MRYANQQDVVLSFIECCEAGAPMEVLAQGFRAATEHLGFRFFACCSHVDPLCPPAQAVMVHNYPVAWARAHSEEKLFLVDPVLQRAERDRMPFFWDSTFSRYSITPLQRKLLAAASDYGVAHGYTVPIHLSWVAGSLRASCSVVPDGASLDKWNYKAVELMATYLFVAATRKSAAPHTPSVKLSHRERQCLTLVAEGKDDWAIGRLLRLSEATVHEYIERAKRRLGVATRTQAVVRALATGQISFGDVVRANVAEAEYESQDCAQSR